MRSSIAASEKDGFRVVHFSIQSNHLHLIVEATDEQSLSRGMQGFRFEWHVRLIVRSATAAPCSQTAITRTS
jgi:REP element-mobilizing transposase RayT